MLQPAVGPSAPHRRPRRSPAGDRITVGLLNNMPDAALAATERQFERLVGGRARLLRFHLPEIARGPQALDFLAPRSAPAEAMESAGLDALIVTGCEPRAANLRDEPYWTALTRAIDWARDHTASTLFSCLAAHAAVLHLDGIERRRLARKCSGVFVCRALAGHPLLAGLPGTVAIPHSRWNALPETDLAAAGYAVLTRSDEAGVDLFVKPGRSLLVFLQGHPEYDADSLAREYRRDLARFRAGERPDRPDLPAHYFDAAVAASLDASAADPQADEPPAIEAPADPPWPGIAEALFANWLALVAARRSARAAAPGVP
ncbi:homoserine O-succinyltransferase MetA [Methylobacterium nodulans]|uniref:Homoserine O-succinyltransferase n=1 Tax=Methylobacterium nodulans (strain LMG 21967 / CNCM I-2342 / ORS 2060) TaxID=460265 RepID=B8IL71_METNO|nr:homoserine O-succinyltransferase [Methylobacterium nodulans]ACL58259.1 homoserine O-succinyltransferase [Methylobacterium nodulans ORS 2060]